MALSSRISFSKRSEDDRMVPCTFPASSKLDSFKAAVTNYLVFVKESLQDLSLGQEEIKQHQDELSSRQAALEELCRYNFNLGAGQIDDLRQRLETTFNLLGAAAEQINSITLYLRQLNESIRHKFKTLQEEQNQSLGVWKQTIIDEVGTYLKKETIGISQECQNMFRALENKEVSGRMELSQRIANIESQMTMLANRSNVESSRRVQPEVVTEC